MICDNFDQMECTTLKWQHWPSNKYQKGNIFDKLVSIHLNFRKFYKVNALDQKILVSWFFKRAVPFTCNRWHFTKGELWKKILIHKMLPYMFHSFQSWGTSVKYLVLRLAEQWNCNTPSFVLYVFPPHIIWPARCECKFFSKRNNAFFFSHAVHEQGVCLEYSCVQQINPDQVSLDRYSLEDVYGEYSHVVFRVNILL